MRGRVHSITVKTDFANIPLPANGKKVQDKLCSRAFAYLGLKKTVFANFPKLPPSANSD